MAQRLRRVAGALGVRTQLLDILGRRRTHDIKLDHNLFEEGRRVVDIVFLSIPEGRTYIRRRILDGDLVKRREPRQLGQESKRRPHHDVLQR